MILKNHEPLDLKCTEGTYVFQGHTHEAFWIHWFKVHMGRGGTFFPLGVFHVYKHYKYFINIHFQQQNIRHEYCVK